MMKHRSNKNEETPCGIVKSIWHFKKEHVGQLGITYPSVSTENYIVNGEGVKAILTSLHLCSVLGRGIAELTKDLTVKHVWMQVENEWYST